MIKFFLVCIASSPGTTHLIGWAWGRGYHVHAMCSQLAGVLKVSVGSSWFVVFCDVEYKALSFSR